MAPSAVSDGSDRPFWGVPFLLHLREDALRFIIDTMCAFRHLSITFDLLLSAHVASLPFYGQHPGDEGMD